MLFVKYFKSKKKIAVSIAALPLTSSEGLRRSRVIRILLSVICYLLSKNKNLTVDNFFAILKLIKPTAFRILLSGRTYDRSFCFV